MKKHHEHAMHRSHESHKKAHHHKKSHMHHSDPIVGGESESEGRVMGQGDFANLPQDVKFKSYPSPSEYGPGVLDDTMGHVDKVNKRAHSQSHKYVSDQH